MAVNNKQYKKALETGDFYARNNKPQKARNWYNVAMDDEETRNMALHRLIKLEIKATNIAKARLLLNNNSDISDEHRNRLLSAIEELEYNFEASKNNLEKAMNVTSEPSLLLLHTSKLYKETGDYDIANMMIETLLNISCNGFQPLFEKVHLHMMKHEYYEAYKILKSIDYKKLLADYEKINYFTLEMYLKYFLGELQLSDNKYGVNNSYRLYRLFNQSDEVLLEHISEHFKEDDAFDSFFFKYLDIKKVLSEVKERIEAMNIIARDICGDIYNIRLDSPIGFRDKEVTYDLQVVTIPGTNIIITMYPIRLSDEYDKEGLATSKTLMKKRILGDNYDK